MNVIYVFGAYNKNTVITIGKLCAIYIYLYKNTCVYIYTFFSLWKLVAKYLQA